MPHVELSNFDVGKMGRHGCSIYISTHFTLVATNYHLPKLRSLVGSTICSNDFDSRASSIVKQSNAEKTGYDDALAGCLVAKIASRWQAEPDSVAFELCLAESVRYVLWRRATNVQPIMGNDSLRYIERRLLLSRLIISGMRSVRGILVHSSLRRAALIIRLLTLVDDVRA